MACSPKPLVVTNQILGIIQIIICLFCLSYSVYVYKTFGITKRKSPLRTSLKVLNSLGMTFFLFCSITLTLNIYYWNAYVCITGPISITITWYLSCFFWSYGQLFSYFLFLDRMHKTFNNSAYQVSECTIYYLYILLFIYALLWFCQFSAPLLYIKDSITPLQNYEFQVWIHVSLCIIDILIVISMTFMFVSRLFKVMIVTAADDSHVMHAHVRMIKAAVKITILAITSLLSSLILITVRMISYQTGWVHIVLSTFGDFWFQLDIVISSVCLLLFLPKTAMLFDILCCCVVKPLTGKITKKLYNQAGSQSSLNHSLEMPLISSKKKENNMMIGI